MTQQIKRNKEIFANAMTQVVLHIWDNEDDFSETQLKKLVSILQELESMIYEDYNSNEETESNDVAEVELKKNTKQVIDSTSREKLHEILGMVR